LVTAGAFLAASLPAPGPEPRNAIAAIATVVAQRTTSSAIRKPRRSVNFSGADGGIAVVRRAAGTSVPVWTYQASDSGMRPGLWASGLGGGFVTPGHYTRSSSGALGLTDSVRFAAPACPPRGPP